MKNSETTVKHPLITEKSTILRDSTGVYCFRADARANKIEIARAVEELFGVKVAEVRTARQRANLGISLRSTAKRRSQEVVEELERPMRPEEPSSDSRS